MTKAEKLNGQVSACRDARRLLEMQLYHSGPTEFSVMGNRFFSDGSKKEFTAEIERMLNNLGRREERLMIRLVGLIGQ